MALMGLVDSFIFLLLVIFVDSSIDSCFDYSIDSPNDSIIVFCIMHVAMPQKVQLYAESQKASQKIYLFNLQLYAQKLERLSYPVHQKNEPSGCD